MFGVSVVAFVAGFWSQYRKVGWASIEAGIDTARDIPKLTSLCKYSGR